VTTFVDRPPDPHPHARDFIRHAFRCATCTPEGADTTEVSPFTWENRTRTFELTYAPDLTKPVRTDAPLSPMCPPGRELLRLYAEAVTDWWHWHLFGETELKDLGPKSLAAQLLESGNLPRCPWVEDSWRQDGVVDVDDLAAHIPGCPVCITRVGYIRYGMGSHLDPLLTRLEHGWRAKSGYQDVRTRYWRGNAIPKSCAFGCRLDDSGWQSLLPAGIPGYQRVLSCREHRLATLYVITVPQAEYANWLPPDYFTKNLT